MNNRKIVLISTAWCAPCKRAKKYLIPEVEKDCPGQTEVVDAADDPKNLAKKYKVQRVPTILLFDGDEMVKSYSGIMPPQGILVDFLKGGDLHGTDRCNW